MKRDKAGSSPQEAEEEKLFASHLKKKKKSDLGDRNSRISTITHPSRHKAKLMWRDNFIKTKLP